jgi:AAA domain
MNWSGKIVSTAEREHLPPRILIYGPAGIGKSSFYAGRSAANVAGLPSPIAIDYDRGIDELPVDRVPGPETWEESLALVKDIASDPGEYRSLVIDTVDPLEALATEYVLRIGKKKALSDFKWGDGYSAILAEWKLLLAELDTARRNGMIVCLVGHAVVREAHDPQLGEYDQATSLLGKKVWALTKAWTDIICYANFDAALAEGANSARIIVTGERKLWTTRGSGYEAKNRYAIEGALPLSWPALEAEIARHRQDDAAIEARILAIAAGTEFEEKAREFIAEAAHNVNALLDIEGALKTKLTEAANAAGA